MLTAAVLVSICSKNAESSRPDDQRTGLRKVSNIAIIGSVEESRFAKQSKQKEGQVNKL